YFEAHEVWEDIWTNAAGPERRFYQGLIQAAVALFHFGNGNVRGAVKLFHSARNYMKELGSPYHGMDVSAFWDRMGHCFAPIWELPDAKTALRPAEEWIPRIELNPPPSAWPEPEAFLREDEK